ncbi:MAG: undecaprenyldiphospho-muramoylpentapeptide beta-N-acetylglucosaminyltransferase [Endozoicomonadaceae bacterium]|nr:undecaprenyldiphospho-muramoylpentapeptide beta-N-acetylglucosaminyltransferase [Endozoicomonadaceae bacterium]MBE8232683.1 undecaprenyldiphospho-muramoylpentapeptide beta-N-acetylglucosaminyltransferase [Endozoicomonadaceae bacterium]
MHQIKKNNTTSDDQPVFLLMAGGTGGHIFPALAVAEILIKRGFSVHWIGTHNRMEATLIPKHNIPIHFITIQGLQRQSIQKWLLAPWQIMKAIQQAYRIMKQLKPKGVLGFGGFVAGPGCISAWLLKIPVFIHEQNTVPGLTNQLSTIFAKKIFTAFPDTFKTLKKTILTGNPIRQTIQAQQLHAIEKKNKILNILILGGSLGATSINQVMPETLAKFKKPLNVWHQTGLNQQYRTQMQYKQYNIEAKLDPFIDDIPTAYQWADLVICRSGAMTISELCAAGKPAILIPYPWHKDQQQLKNAQYLVSRNAAKIIEQHQLSATHLAQMMHHLTQEKKTLMMMGAAAYQCAKTQAALHIVTICEQYL